MSSEDKTAEPTEFGTFADLKAHSGGQRRYGKVFVPALKKWFRFRSLDGWEFTNYEAALRRANNAGQTGDAEKHEELLSAAYEDLLMMALVGGDDRQLVNEEEREVVHALDSPIREFLAEAIANHVSKGAAESEDFAKN